MKPALKIACLHTAASNIEIFDEAAAMLGPSAPCLTHEVTPHLLAAAEREGGLSDHIAAETAQHLARMADKADAVILNCSTLGPSIANLTGHAAERAIRVDAALAEEAVAKGGRVAVLCTVETTLAPTGALFSAAAEKTGALCDIRLVPDAWAHFRSGHIEAYLTAIAKAAEEAYAEGIATIAFAQASMTRAAAKVTNAPAPLTSPKAALLSAMKRFGTDGRM